jgi:uncharacterized protein (DUF697 family)
MTEEAVLPLSELDASQEKEQSAPSQPETKAARRKRAMKTVKIYVAVSGGIGFIPAPLFDQVVIAGVCAKMLNDLCQIYDVKFSEHKIKAIVMSVLGGAHSDWITYPITSYLGFIPGVNIIARPVVSGTIIYAIGRLFIHHLNSGAWR